MRLIFTAPVVVFVFIASLISACGGGGGGSNTTTSTSTTPPVTDTGTSGGNSSSPTDSARDGVIRGFAIDGYVEGAFVYIDQNFNFQYDEGEYFATSDSQGGFSIVAALGGPVGMSRPEEIECPEDTEQDDDGTESESESQTDGDDSDENGTSDGTDVCDANTAGENSDGEGTDGEGTDGEGTDGEGTDGEGTDGEGTDGEGTDGEGTDGEGTDGEGTDGEGTDGEGTDGEGTDGEGTDGEGTDGEGTDGEGTDGEVIEEVVYEIDWDVYECLINRPIIADVPVGAVDSTRGVVEQAYTMVLPSIKDAETTLGEGVDQKYRVVISPFTSLLSDAIIEGKSSLVENLTLEQGCSAEGDAVAASVSTELVQLKNILTTNFGITYADLIGDFIADTPEKVTEKTAQNLVDMLPYIGRIEDLINEYLSDRFNKEIRVNISLGSESMETLFQEDEWSRLPLSFSAQYVTEPNEFGWYQVESIESEGAFMNREGTLAREHCSEEDTVLCDQNELSLESLGNVSTHFRHQSAFVKDNISIDGVDGDIQVQAVDNRGWRNQSLNWQELDNRARECQTNNEITLRNEETEYHYSSYSQAYGIADCRDATHYYFPNTIVSSFRSKGGLEAHYYIPDIVRTGIMSETPYDFIANQLSINPTTYIQEITELPGSFKQVDEIRAMFNVDDYVLFRLGGGDNGLFEFGTFPRNDMYKDSFDSAPIFGQAARDAAHAKLLETFGTEAVNAEPPGSNVLGRISARTVKVVARDNAGNTHHLPTYSTYSEDNRAVVLNLQGASLNPQSIRDAITGVLDSNQLPLELLVPFNNDDSVAGDFPVLVELYQGNDAVRSGAEQKISVELSVRAENADGVLSLSVVPDSAVTVTLTDGANTFTKQLSGAQFETMAISANGVQAFSIVNVLAPAYADGLEQLTAFFATESSYFFSLSISDSDLMFIDHDRNSANKLMGSFNTSNTFVFPIEGDDIDVYEGDTESLCFTRNVAGNLNAGKIAIDFELMDRPGRGATEDDFELSSNEIVFAQGEFESCISIHAPKDNVYDWMHEARFNLRVTEGDLVLARDNVRVRIYSAASSNRFTSQAY